MQKKSFDMPDEVKELLNARKKHYEELLELGSGSTVKKEVLERLAEKFTRLVYPELNNIQPQI